MVRVSDARRVAVHEAAHATVAAELGIPVESIRLDPRRARASTTVRDADRRPLSDQLILALSGLVGETLDAGNGRDMVEARTLDAFDSPSSAASSDLERAGALLRGLCGRDRRRARHETRQAIASATVILQGRRRSWLRLAGELEDAAEDGATARFVAPALARP